MTLGLELGLGLDWDWDWDWDRGWYWELGSLAPTYANSIIDTLTASHNKVEVYFMYVSCKRHHPCKHIARWSYREVLV